MTLHPHHASSARNTELAHFIRDQWTDFGFDAKLIKYNVLLSFPEKGKINGASLHDGNGTVRFQTAKTEKALEPSEESPDALPPFSGYSPTGKFKVTKSGSDMSCISEKHFLNFHLQASSSKYKLIKMNITTGKCSTWK